MKKSDFTRKFAVLLVAVAVITVIVHLLLSLYFEPAKIVGRKITKIATDYYENYFYPNYVGDASGDELVEKMSKFEENGFSRTYLRQLLLFNDGKYQKDAKYFRYDGFTCDTNASYVQYYPIAPFSATDYRIEYHLQCE